MKLINKPPQDDIDFFGVIPAYCMSNGGKIVFIIAIVVCIVFYIISKTNSSKKA